jgi:hypothetical protein
VDFQLSLPAGRNDGLDGNPLTFSHLNGPAARLVRQAPRLLMSGAGRLDRASVMGSPRGHQPMLGNAILAAPLLSPRVTPCSPAAGGSGRSDKVGQAERVESTRST